MKKVASELVHLSNLSDHNIQTFKLEVALDIMDYKLIKCTPEKSKKPKPELICKVFFDNKTIEMINLPRTFNLADVKLKIPSDCKLMKPLSLLCTGEQKNRLELDFCETEAYPPCDCSSCGDKNHLQNQVISFICV